MDYPTSLPFHLCDSSRKSILYKNYKLIWIQNQIFIQALSRSPLSDCLLYGKIIYLFDNFYCLLSGGCCWRKLFAQKFWTKNKIQKALKTFRPNFYPDVTCPKGEAWWREGAGGGHAARSILRPTYFRKNLRPDWRQSNRWHKQYKQLARGSANCFGY